LQFGLKIVLRGRVVFASGRHYEVETADGRRLRAFPKSRREAFACGDLVEIDAHGAVVSMQPRTSLFYRSDALREKIIAANADQVLVVVATEPGFDSELASRALVAAEHQRLGALVVLNKTDLVPRDCLPDLEREIQARNPGVPVVAAVHCDIDLRLLYSGRSTAGALRAHHAHPGHDQFESVEIAVPPGLDPDQVERLVRAHRAWRVKGFVRIDGDPWVVQGVGRRLEIVPARGGVDPALLGRLVLIRRVAGAAVGVTG